MKSCLPIGFKEDSWVFLVDIYGSIDCDNDILKGIEVDDFFVGMSQIPIPPSRTQKNQSRMDGACE